MQYLERNKVEFSHAILNFLLLNRESFFLRFFRLALINILSNLMVPLAGLLSIAFLGHLTEIRHLAGVTLSTVLFNYIYRALGFLRPSTTGITAQAVGRKDREEVLLIGLRSGLLALILGLIIVILHVPLRNIGFAILNATLEVKASGLAYYDARILGMPAALLNFVFIGWFLGREQSGKVLLMSAVGNGASILLDYLLIVRLGWESMGAGLATAASQYLMLIVGVLLVVREVKFKEILAIADQIFSRSALKDTLILNRDIFIRTLVLLSTFSIFTNFSSAMGTAVLTENALLLQVVTFAAFAIDGLAFATESLTGIYQGKGDKKQLIPLLRIAGLTSLVVGFIFAFAFILFPHTLFGLLTNHIEIVARLHHYVIWLLPVLGFGAIAFMLDGYFLGLAERVILRNTSLVATFIVFLPLAIVAWHFHSNHWLWLAMTSFMAARAILLAIQVPRTLKS
jgi:multidrug resistance protein, MATE family